MLWFDNDAQVNFDAKISRAITYYWEKYGQKPNLCFVNPSMLPAADSQKDETPKPDGIEIRESNTMLPNHFWIGVNRQKS